jgi:hypothetical protein
MKRLRELFGGEKDAARPDAAAPDSAAEPPEDEAARELRLQREFYSGLSEVARHELQFQDYAPEAPSQTKRTGRWVVAEPTDALDEAGRAVLLEAGTALDYVDARHDDDAGRRVRFRTADGRQVDIAAPPGEDWPPSIVRPSDLESAGSG